jgi:hypothetical protein
MMFMNCQLLRQFGAHVLRAAAAGGCRETERERSDWFILYSPMLKSSFTLLDRRITVPSVDG